MKADVVVIGGGSAGVAAAVTAARQGASTLLVERGVRPGGNASAANVHTLCGLYLLRDSETVSLEYANDGFPKEMAETLLGSGGARGPVRMGRLDVLLHNPAAYAATAMSFISQLPSLKLLTGRTLRNVLQNRDGSIRSLEFSSSEGHLDVEVGAVVDATGDCGAALAAGASTDITNFENLQRPAYVLGFQGVTPDLATDDGRLILAHAIASAVGRNTLPKEALGTSFREGVVSGELWMTVDLTAERFDPRVESDREALFREAADLAGSIASLLRDRLEGFRNAVISSRPERLGIRESRRIVGNYTLTGNDVLTGRRFPKEAALSAWPVELRERAGHVSLRFPEGGAPCGIPMDCLRSRDISNLLAAGRCISATHEAQAAIRVIGTSLATGEAAGREAAAMVGQVRTGGGS